MAAETVLDYLGHPCQIAKAMDHFKEPFEASRVLDPRELVREIGKILNELNERTEHTCAAMDVARNLLPNSSDDYELGAVLAIAAPYHLDSANMLFALTGHVLAALERGKLLEVSHV